MIDTAFKSALTPLELDLLDRFHSRYKQLGFPPPEGIRVKFRQSSSAGRCTYFEHEGHVQRVDGQLDLGRFSQFDMVGLDAGASFWVEIENSKVLYLEINVNGEQEWDCSELRWIVLDPDTGELTSKNGME
ncbi:hypothetical protein [Lysobacter sp. GCM10012299]|uniref:hypothetical protein n=1 Tax=Lysobacter sp. GCM10012299 TaxID=3317333 RepID=UPI003615A825